MISKASYPFENVAIGMVELKLIYVSDKSKSILKMSYKLSNFGQDMNTQTESLKTANKQVQQAITSINQNGFIALERSAISYRWI